MASMKLAAAALAVLVLVCAAATTATARSYRPEPKFEAEDCKTQATYFKNCLSHGVQFQYEKCCERRVDAAGRNCYCEVEREAHIQCAKGRSCPGPEGIVKVGEMHLSCLKNLHCKRA